MTTGTTRTMFLAQLQAEQRIFWRNISSVFFTFVLPMLLLFALALGNDPAGNVPYIIAISVISTAFQGLGMQLAMHRDQGVLKGLMSTPLPPWVLIGAKAVSIALIIAIEIVFVVAMSALLFGASLPEHPAGLFAFVLLGTCAFAALAFALVSIIPNSDSAPAVVNGAYLAILMSSIMLRTIDGVPHALYVIGGLIPFAALVDQIEVSWFGPWHGFPWGSSAVLAGWLAIGAIWTSRRFRWEPGSNT
jgi:ABC-2 type transport system permease protein